MNKLFAGFTVSLLLFGSALVFTSAQAEDKPKAPTVKDLLTEGDKEEEQGTEIKTPPPIKGPIDKYYRNTPASSIKGISEAMTARDYEKVLLYMDMRNLPRELRNQDLELARQLTIVADNAIWVSSETLSNDPMGHGDDGLPSYRDRIVRIETPDGPLDLLMQRVPGEKDMFIWKISNKTVADIPRLYELYGYGPIGDFVSKFFPEVNIMGMLLWQWAMMAALLAFAYLVSWLFTKAMMIYFRWRAGGQPSVHRKRFIGRSLRFFIFVMIFRSLFDVISPTVGLRAIFEAQTLFIIAMAWLVMGFSEFLLSKIGDRMHEAGREDAVVILRPTGTAINVIILGIAIIVWLDNLGFKVSTLLAGLGVGSIAIALAAQKSIENLIGAITMFTAQPVRIGDFCQFGETVGTVEEIGLRATMVRTLDRTMVTVPNATFASMPLENYAKRDKFLYRRQLRLRTDTSPDQIRYILLEVRKLLYSHPKVDQDPARVRFVEFGKYAFEVDVFAYVLVNELNDYLAIAEDINLRILDVIAQAGSQLALPSQSIHTENSIDRDENLARDAEAKIQALREKQGLGLPEFSAAERARLKGSLDYPPKGSVT